MLESAKELAHIIQCQTHLHSCVLVIPLVDFALPLSWQPFPLSLVPLGPSLVHIFLGRFSPNKAINTCGISVAEALATGPVSRAAEHSVSRLSAFTGALFRFVHFVPNSCKPLYCFQLQPTWVISSFLFSHIFHVSLPNGPLSIINKTAHFH